MTHQTTSLQNITDLPVLAGWVSLTEAATILGVSRQYASKQAATGGFRSVHRIGASPSFVVSIFEVEAMLATRAEKQPQLSSQASQGNTFRNSKENA